MMNTPIRNTVIALLALLIVPVVVAVLLPQALPYLLFSNHSICICLLSGFAAVLLLRLAELTSAPSNLGSTSQKLEALVTKATSQMTNSVVVCDAQGIIIWVNQAFSDATGFSFAESVGQRPGHLLQGSGTDPGVIAKMNTHLRSGKPFSGDILNYRKDGSPFWVYLEIRHIRDADGNIEAIFGSQADITKRKLYELQQEQDLNAALAAADLDPLTSLLNHRAFHNELNAQSSIADLQHSKLAVLLIDLDNFRFFNEAYGHLVGDTVLKQVAETLTSASAGFGFESIARFGGDEFAMIVPRIDQAQQPVLPQEIEKLFYHLGYRPVGFDRPLPISISVGMAFYPDDGLTTRDLLDVADKRLMLAKIGAQDSRDADELRKVVHNRDGFSMLDALVTAVDNKDRYTRRHSEDVQCHALNIAKQLQLDNDQQKNLAIAALLHDVGKIGVPDRILRKPGPLDDQEFQAIKQHPQMGAAIVGAVEGFDKTLDAILYHHERWDGLGYPSKLCGTQIPLLARIMAVADGYSAMTTDRPYRRGMSSEEAIAILNFGSGTQWDPDIVEAMVSFSKATVGLD